MKRNVNTKLRSADAQTKRFGLGMLSPTVVILLIMTAYPLFFTLVYSFTDYNLLRSLKKGSHFIALQNYTKLLSDPYFQQSILNTVKFTILAVIFEMFIGLVMALFVNSLKRGQKTMRTLLLLPYLLPTVTVALSWRMMLSPNYGIVNQVLQALHLPVYNWFSDIHTAFGMLVLIDVWQSAPFVFLLLYAALQSVPQSQYEAARIDGANRFKILFYVTPSQHQEQPGPVRPAAYHRQLPAVRQGEPADRRWSRQQHLHHHPVPLQLRYQVPGLRLRQRGRHRDDRSGPAAFQCVHQTCDFVSAYGREEVNSYFCKCGLRRGYSSGKPGSLQA